MISALSVIWVLAVFIIPAADTLGIATAQLADPKAAVMAHRLMQVLLTAPSATRADRTPRAQGDEQCG